jgi:hypothetical protein
MVMTRETANPTRKTPPSQGGEPTLTDDDAQRTPLAAPGLGDLAAEFFTSLGITEERYRSVKVKLHLDPKCNCADRRRWLNEVGAKLGVDGVVLKLAKWMDGRG